MRLCADENIARDTVLRLREAGHDVLWIREAAPGMADIEVLMRSSVEQRLLLTFDKDFGDLVYRLNAPSPAGIVFFRITQSSPSAVATRILAVLNSRDDWAGHFSVVDDSTIRMRPLQPKL
jgi:predicted nuclease of predicted toxin-antitoxin system